MGWIFGLIATIVGWLTGRTANRDEELGTQKAENKQLRDDIDVIKRTDEAVKKAQDQAAKGGPNDPDDLDSVQRPNP